MLSTPAQPIRHRDVHPTAGQLYGTSIPEYHRQRVEQKKNSENTTGPFENQDEFELVRWLDKDAVGQGARQELFELNIVRGVHILW